MIQMMNAKEEDRQEICRKLLEETFPKFLDMAERTMKTNGGSYVAGSKVRFFI